MAWWSRFDPERDFETRFTPLLVSLLIYIFGILPVVEAGRTRTLVTTIVFSVLTLSGALAISNSRKTLNRAAVFAGILIAVDWWRYFHRSRLTILVSFIVVAMAILIAIYFVLRRVSAAKRVTAQTIQGAICGYLLLVVWWSYLYFLIGLSGSHAFEGLGAGNVESSIDYLYFSFVTMTTLGFGDISPVTEIARSLVSLQALVGQFYMAILVARLVAIQIHDSER